MKFGIRYCNTGRYTDPTRAVELVQAAEEAGFDRLGISCVALWPDTYQLQALAAAATRRIRSTGTSHSFAARSGVVAMPNIATWHLPDDRSAMKVGKPLSI